jgi:hypothetical protein
MKIRVIGHAGEGKFPFGVSGPWNQFEKILLARGHEISPPDMAETADALIANFYSKSIGNYLAKSEIPKNKRILVLWEPYVVENIRYKKENISKFGSIFAPSIDWAEEVEAYSFKWPQDEIPDDNVFDNWNSRINRAVMVQGNKFSAKKGELYSLRRRVIVNLGDKTLDLFGTNWNKGLTFDIRKWVRSGITSRISEICIRSIYGIGKEYNNYFGATTDKNKTLSEYKIAVVIENSEDFVSEKLFDAIRAGCVVVYVGPCLEKYGIPIGAAIQIEAEENLISNAVRQLLDKSSQELEEIAKIQRMNLKKVSHEWNNTFVLSKLASDMVDILEAH